MNVVCPKCLSEETIRLDVADGDTLTCAGCDEEYSFDNVVELIESWTKLIPWIKAHPARQLELADAK